MDSGQPPLSPTVAQAVHGLLRPSFPLAKLRDGGFLRALCSQPAGCSQSLHFIHWTDLPYALPSVPFRRGGLDEVISHKRAGFVCRLGRIPVRDLQAPPQAQPCTRQASLHVPLQTSETCGQEIALWDVSDSQKRSSTRGPSFTETLRGSACRSGLRRPQRWSVRQPQTRGPVFSPLPQSRGRPPSRRSSAQALVCLDSRPLKVGCRLRIARGSRWGQAALTRLGGPLSSPVLSPLRGAVPR